jgi:hypothetical protein
MSNSPTSVVPPQWAPAAMTLPGRLLVRVTGITGWEAVVAARLGCAMGRACRLARHGERAALSGGSSLWAGFGLAAGIPFSNFGLF